MVNWNSLSNRIDTVYEISVPYVCTIKLWPETYQYTRRIWGQLIEDITADTQNTVLAWFYSVDMIYPSTVQV